MKKKTWMFIKFIITELAQDILQGKTQFYHVLILLMEPILLTCSDHMGFRTSPWPDMSTFFPLLTCACPRDSQDLCQYFLLIEWVLLLVTLQIVKLSRSAIEWIGLDVILHVLEQHYHEIYGNALFVKASCVLDVQNIWNWDLSTHYRSTHASQQWGTNG